MVPVPLRHPQKYFCLPEWRFWLIVIYYSQHSDNVVISPLNQPKLFKENWEDQSLSLKKSSLLEQERGKLRICRKTENMGKKLVYKI